MLYRFALWIYIYNTLSLHRIQGFVKNVAKGIEKLSQEDNKGFKLQKWRLKTELRKITAEKMNLFS